MAAPNILNQNVQNWTLVLRALNALEPSITVRAHEKLALTDEHFDHPDAADTTWFQLDPAHYDLFLDDSVGTVHLANLSGRVNYLADETSLVTWYGHDPERYRILLNSHENVERTSLPDQELSWFAWDTGRWTLYAHDGKSLIPVFNPSEIAAALEIDSALDIWMGWNGLRVDVFTVTPGRLPKDLCAAFVAQDQSVGTVHSKG